MLAKFTRKIRSSYLHGFTSFRCVRIVSSPPSTSQIKCQSFKHISRNKRSPQSTLTTNVIAGSDLVLVVEGLTRHETLSESLWGEDFDGVIDSRGGEDGVVRVTGHDVGY